jgi:hypothetical protein
MTIYQHDYLICPWCDAESGVRIDHLYANDLPFVSEGYGGWKCHECRMPIGVRVTAPGKVETWKVDRVPQEFSRAMALLRFDGKDGPVFFVMDHDRYSEKGAWAPDDEFQSSQRYFFEEHSCPTNWLRDCVMVIEGGDCDPHGFLSFVRAVDVPNDFDTDDNAAVAALFPEAFDGA